MTSNPCFASGKVQIGDIPQNQRRNCVIKYGNVSKLTAGHLHLSGLHVRSVNEELGITECSGGMECTKKFKMFYQQEIKSSSSYPFFEAGDSGALVFMLNDPEGNDLHCIGIAIGVTSYQSCIMTPIDAVLSKLQLPGNLKSFQTSNNTHVLSSPAQQPGMSENQDPIQLLLATMTKMEMSIKSEMNSMKTTLENKFQSEMTEVKQEIACLKALHDGSTNDIRNNNRVNHDSDSESL